MSTLSTLTGKRITLIGFGPNEGKVKSVEVVNVTDSKATFKDDNGEYIFDTTNGQGSIKNWKIPGKLLEEPKPIEHAATDKPERPAKTGKAATAGAAATERVRRETPADTPCKCGCGEVTSRGRNFLQGHDSKAHSMIKKALRGQITENDVPKSATWVLEQITHEGGFGSQNPTDKPPKATANGKASSNGKAPVSSEAAQPEAPEISLETIADKAEAIGDAADKELLPA